MYAHKTSLSFSGPQDDEGSISPLRFRLVPRDCTLRDKWFDDLKLEQPSDSSVDEQSSSDSDDTSGGCDATATESLTPHPWPPKGIVFPVYTISALDDNGNLTHRSQGIMFPVVTISAFTEIGQAESSIEVPLQRSYTSPAPVIPSSLADTPCATLGIPGVLDGLNATLGTSYTLDTPSLPSILGDFVEKNYDFGTAYGRLRRIWYTDNWSNIRDELCRWEEADDEMRKRALDGNLIVHPDLPPRRVWDLYSNRVVPWWTVNIPGEPWLRWQPISHAWVDNQDRVDVWTPINEKEWPVAIPKDANLDLIRIEMLNLGLRYIWLDVLCLRQKGGAKEDLRVDEWKLDVPTIGRVYMNEMVVIYLSGLGLPLSMKEGDLDSDRCWFRRAWTLQEAGNNGRIIAGDTPDGPLHAKQIDEDGNYETELLTRLHKQLRVDQSHAATIFSHSLFNRLADMRNRVSANPVDKVAGLKFSLAHQRMPAYKENESFEDAWTALVSAMSTWMRISFLLVYPGVGLGYKKWRPTWEQILMEPLPVDYIGEVGWVNYDPDTDEDTFDGPCIEKGHVRGLDVGFAEGEDWCGELVVEGADGMQHTFTIHVTHQILIPEDTYMLLGSTSWEENLNLGRMSRQCWAIGRQLQDKRFQKVSVVVLEEREGTSRLKDLWTDGEPYVLD
ncbi:hypothetical protein EDD85DRAFT_212344 [Armillaria nabsnona]|nr:hypothetical protein EDD85DRAFT_212344 [Armillaria nabsnona]